MSLELPFFGSLVLGAVLVVATYTMTLGVIAGRGRLELTPAVRSGVYACWGLVAVAVEAQRETLLEQIARAGYPRLPVYRNDLDTVVGMLYVTDVHPAQRARVPAITHVDGTARVQTVHRDTDPRYYRLIEAFGRATGVPLLLNTSFNLKGEPIVNTPAEALRTFTGSGLDILVLGDCVVEKPRERS